MDGKQEIIKVFLTLTDTFQRMGYQTQSASSVLTSIGSDRR
jgi:hypothetical protein